MRFSARRSVRTISSMSGYCTLTATSSPDGRRARCTWPIDADATGTGENSANTSVGARPPNSSRSRASMSWYGRGGT